MTHDSNSDAMTCQPQAVQRLRRALEQRDVRLAHLLRQPGLPDVALQFTAPKNPSAEGRIEKWLVLDGTRGWAARIGLTSRLVQRMGLHIDERAELLDALAAQLLAPMMGALRALCEDDLQVRVVDGAQEPGSGPDVLTIGLRSRIGTPELLPIGVPARLVRRVAEYAEQAPMLPSAATLTLMLGHVLRLSLESLRALEVGDVLLADTTDADRSAGLYVDAGPAARPVRIASVDTADGRILRVAPHGWRAWPASGSDGPLLALEVALAHITLPAESLRVLAVGTVLPGWPGTLLTPARLRLAGRPIADLRGTRVAGRPGAEIVRLVAAGDDTRPAPG